MEKVGSGGGNDENLARMRATAEFARSMAERAQSGVKALETQLDSQGRRTLGSLFALLLVAAAGGVGVWRLNTKLETQAFPQSAAVPRRDQETENRIAVLSERISALESQQEAERQRIDALLGNLSAPPVSQVAPAPSDVTPSQANLDSIQNQIAREGQKFEIQKGHAVEVIPGVLINVKDVNADRQQVSGWIYLQHQKQYILLTNRGRLQPVTFFSPEDHQQHDIVITSVTRRQVDGYVLSPKATNAAIADN